MNAETFLAALDGMLRRVARCRSLALLPTFAGLLAAAAILAEIWAPATTAAVLLLLGFLVTLTLYVVRLHRARERATRSAVAATASAEEGRRRVAELEEAQRAGAILAAIVTSSNDAIISKTLDGVITSWNPGAEHLFGYTASEVIGLPVISLFPPELRGDEAVILERIRRGETVGHFDTMRRHKDGHDIDVSVTVSPIRDATGRVVGASKIARDISDRKRAVDELQRYRRSLEAQVVERTREIAAANSRLEAALKEANEANQAKSRFLANMSHEIRTPMNAILGFVGLVLERDIPADIRRQLRMAHKAATSLLALMNDILDLSRLQSGSLLLEPVVFDLRNLLRACLDQVRDKALERGLTLELHFGPDLPPARIGDPARVRQIVQNLLSNAIKFTEAGRVILSAGAVDGACMVELVVADTGIGMAADQAERIFDRFFQVDGGRTRRFSGSGLGVSICKELAELMGGTVRVESQLGQGSTFRVQLWLPAAADSLQSLAGEEEYRELADSAAPLPGPACHPLSVLLVDDVPENRELANIHLTGRGHAVTTAVDGAAAVDLVRRQRFDLVLMDVQMPRMNGKEATRRIRDLEGGGGSRLPIIGLSADEGPAERNACLAAGMTAYVTKPINFDTLAKLMLRLVPDKAGSPPMAMAAPEPLSTAVTVPAPVRQELAALRTALESDDPDIIEPVLDRLGAAGLDQLAVRCFRRLVGEFEFAQARAVAATLDQTLATRWTEAAAADQGCPGHA
ncbi:PAS domain-containing hybrid sensor histidine kinase/response regulator [Nitrospirillum iridis]|uniref:histidine kinase n=1 Tax=Nitrospirillum iridis TaxID=765888 RepID=A0A7X0ATJ1_9PROT|nr:PAS domain-containing hybrid sensor histidine kinase/response regulator [Nitrospirillum iridis]MBB6249847.1 PAS domain S-box-containing protein [Nitrospirillum iridis]